MAGVGVGSGHQDGNLQQQQQQQQQQPRPIADGRWVHESMQLPAAMQEVQLWLGGGAAWMWPCKLNCRWDWGDTLVVPATNAGISVVTDTNGRGGRGQDGASQQQSWPVVNGMWVHE